MYFGLQILQMKSAGFHRIWYVHLRKYTFVSTCVRAF